MEFRYRKSINLGGGFRINLSKSGIEYSWGTKGLELPNRKFKKKLGYEVCIANKLIEFC